jgi:hypothetical protein
MQYSVRDSIRTLKFNGTKLAESSSKAPNKSRWVEFQLYVTNSGIYVLARKGASILYHNESCPVVSRNKLSVVDGEELPTYYVPCNDCKPSRISVTGVFPETARYWAQHSEKAQGVIDALMQFDDNDTKYLTRVASDLLEEAAKYDANIKYAFETEIIE